ACDRTATARVLGYLFFTDAAPTGFCARSLHDALPILGQSNFHEAGVLRASGRRTPLLPAPSIQGVRPQPASLRELARRLAARPPDRKSTRLNSSHVKTSYAVFCLKKKTRNGTPHR